MPLITQHTDALAFVDPEPSTTAARAALDALVRAELPADHTTALHPSIPASYEPRFSPALAAEHARIAAASSSSAAAPSKYSIGGISSARYEALEPPSSSKDGGQAEAAWKPALRAAYTNAAYLSARATHLQLLEQHGRNAWLVGNWQLEGTQRALDAEIAAARTDVDEVQAARRAGQAGAAAELAALEESWREGVGRVVRVQVAAEELRRKVLERRREGAV